MAGISPASKRQRVLALSEVDRGAWEGDGQRPDLIEFLSQRGGRARELEREVAEAAQQNAKLAADLRAAQTELRVTKVPK